MAPLESKVAQLAPTPASVLAVDQALEVPGMETVMAV